MTDNINDFLNEVDSLSAFELAENIESMELVENEEIPEGFEIVENYIGGSKLVQNRAKRQVKPITKQPSWKERNPNGSTQVFDLYLSAPAVSGHAATKAILVDLLTCNKLPYAVDCTAESKLHTDLGVTSVGFASKEYAMITDATTVTSKANFHLPTFYREHLNTGIAIERIRLNVPDGQLPYVRSGVLAFYSFTPQGRIKTNQLNIANFITPTHFNPNVIDVLINITLKRNEICVLECTGGISAQNTAFSIGVTVSYK